MSKLGTTRPTSVVDLVTNLGLLAEHQAASDELAHLNRTQSAADRMNNPYSKEIRAAAKKVQDIEKQMEESTVCIKLQAPELSLKLATGVFFIVVESRMIVDGTLKFSGET